ncbi:hypothetical protein AAHA92_22125 [Salvia divinorum]|uniref:Uncharacterized protein n=1 Tax=Salvia divinorum TaxID=28513 RepID=A0ABD1GNU6_SALDI
MAKVEEIAAIFKRFGDEQSTLLDQYERLSFEVQLNNAMLGRSLSETPVACRHAPPPVKQGRRAAGFQKVMRKLFTPILGRKGPRKDGQSETNKLLFFSKNFSRSLRV